MATNPQNVIMVQETDHGALVEQVADDEDDNNEDDDEELEGAGIALAEEVQDMEEGEGGEGAGHGEEDLLAQAMPPEKNFMCGVSCSV
jgi:hypothetical protein